MRVAVDHAVAQERPVPRLERAIRHPRPRFADAALEVALAPSSHSSVSSSSDARGTRGTRTAGVSASMVP